MTGRVVCLLAFAGVTLAAPNFSGSWKINASKSKSGGQYPLPEKFERKITHNEPVLQMTTVRSGFLGGDDFTSVAKHTTDGKVTTNLGFLGIDLKSVAKWEGDVLVIQSYAAEADESFTSSERWSLSSDGKILEVKRKITGGFGAFEMTYVMEKQ